MELNTTRYTPFTNGRVKFSKLYDTVEKIPAILFFQILKEKNLQLLNPRQVKIKAEKLSEIWGKIVEEYFKRSNPTKYKSDLKKLTSIEFLRNEIIGCTAALQLCLFNENDQESIDALLEFGYNYKKEGAKKIRSRLLAKKTKLTLQISTYEKKHNSSEEQEAINFWKLVESVETARGLSLTAIETMTLDRWIVIYESVKQTAKQKRQAIKKGKK